jgi:TorA maturation chaperone TorD
MSQDATPMQFSPTLPAEEAARADFYALLARLYYDAPDAALLASLAGAEEIVAEESSGEGAGFALAWRDLTLAAAAADAAAVEEEYQTLFVGVGKALITPYAGAYLATSTADAPLVELRDYLARRGIARKTSVSEPEDHFAALCELMRFLIAERHAPLEEQRSVFDRFLRPAANKLCDAVITCEQAGFYRAVASFTNQFIEVEYAAFRM